MTSSPESDSEDFADSAARTLARLDRWEVPALSHLRDSDLDYRNAITAATLLLECCRNRLIRIGSSYQKLTAYVDAYHARMALVRPDAQQPLFPEPTPVQNSPAPGPLVEATPFLANNPVAVPQPVPPPPQPAVVRPAQRTPTPRRSRPSARQAVEASPNGRSREKLFIPPSPETEEAKKARVVRALRNLIAEHRLVVGDPCYRLINVRAFPDQRATAEVMSPETVVSDSRWDTWAKGLLFVIVRGPGSTRNSVLLISPNKLAAREDEDMPDEPLFSRGGWEI